MNALKLEKQDEENVVNQEKGTNTEGQKLQSIDTSKLETNDSKDENKQSSKTKIKES